MGTNADAISKAIGRIFKVKLKDDTCMKILIEKLSACSIASGQMLEYTTAKSADISGPTYCSLPSWLHILCSRGQETIVGSEYTHALDFEHIAGYDESKIIETIQVLCAEVRE